MCIGIDNDNTIRVPGEGGVSAKSPQPGDVYVTFRVSSPSLSDVEISIFSLEDD